MKKVMAIIVMVCMLLFSSAYAENATAALQDLYAHAELAMATGDYAGAAAKFEALGTYSDASQMAMYCKAIAAAETLGMYDVAVSAFAGLGDFKDSKQMATYYTARGYQAVGDAIDITAASDGDLELAKFSYDKGAETYAGLVLFKDCLVRMSECQTQSKAVEAEQKSRATAKLEASYQAAIVLEENGEYKKAIDAFTAIKSYKDSGERIVVCQNVIYEEKYQEALTFEENAEYQKAIDAFTTIKSYRDSEEHITTCRNAIFEAKYQEAMAFEENGEYQRAIDTFATIKTYKDSEKHLTDCENAILKLTYYEALNLKLNDEFRSAYELFISLGDYEDSRAQASLCVSGIYNLQSGKTESDFILYNNFIFGMNHKDFIEQGKDTGFTTEYTSNGYAFKHDAWAGYYWEKEKNIFDFGVGDISVYFTNGEVSDNAQLMGVIYTFGGYGTKNRQSNESALNRFMQINDWMNQLYGSPAFDENDSDVFVVLPDEYMYVPTGVNGKNNFKAYPWSQWVIKLDDGKYLSIVNEIDTYNDQNKLIYILFEKDSVNKLFENID